MRTRAERSFVNTSEFQILFITGLILSYIMFLSLNVTVNYYPKIEDYMNSKKSFLATVIYHKSRNFLIFLVHIFSPGSNKLHLLFNQTRCCRVCVVFVLHSSVSKIYYESKHCNTSADISKPVIWTLYELWKLLAFEIKLNNYLLYNSEFEGQHSGKKMYTASLRALQL